MKFIKSWFITFIIKNIKSEVNFNNDNNDLFLRKNAEIKKALN